MTRGVSAAGVEIPVRRWRFLRSAERLVDDVAIPATRVVVTLIGIAFAVLLCLAVVGRYGVRFPLAEIEDIARILLVWFFMLGMGLAYHSRSHVALTMFVDWLSPSPRHYALLFGQLVGVVFVLHVFAGGWIGIREASQQVEPTLGISGLWAGCAMPVGLALLLVHQLRALLVALHDGPRQPNDA